MEDQFIEEVKKRKEQNNRNDRWQPSSTSAGAMFTMPCKS